VNRRFALILGAGLALAGAPPCVLADAGRPDHDHDHGHVHATAARVLDGRLTDPARMAQRAELLREGEQRLSQGDADGAERTFERAASMLHAADTEMGLVRAAMQAGDYRRATDFAAHTAGAHAEDVSGAALYAWLLHLGGQVAFAQTVLDKAQASVGPRVAGQSVIAQTREALAASVPVAPAALRQAPARLAPYAHGAVVPPGSRVMGTGFLLPDGLSALLPASCLPPAGGGLWLRDGLGQTVVAAVDAVDAAAPQHGLVRVKLSAPLSSRDGIGMDEVWRVPPQDAYAGSPAVALVQGLGAGDQAGWPLMRLGFLGMPLAESPWRKLGIDVSAPELGGPVLDLSGRLLGISLKGDQGRALMVPVSLLRQDWGDALGRVSHEPASTRQPLDVLYERALRTTLQVIVAAP